MQRILVFVLPDTGVKKKSLERNAAEHVCALMQGGIICHDTAGTRSFTLATGPFAESLVIHNLLQTTCIVLSGSAYRTVGF